MYVLVLSPHLKDKAIQNSFALSDHLESKEKLCSNFMGFLYGFVNYVISCGVFDLCSIDRINSWLKNRVPHVIFKKFTIEPP